MKQFVSKISLTVVFLFLSITFLSAQETVSDYLLTAFEDLNLQQYDAQRDFLSPRNYRLPIIDELELRAGNDELNYEDLQYAVRIRPGNPWKIRRNNAFFNATKKELSLRKELEFKENLLSRYEDVLDYLFEQQFYELVLKQSSLTSQKATIFQQNMESDLFDARDFAETKIDQVEKLESLDDVLTEWNQIRKTISVIFGVSDFDWSTFELISVSTIDSLATELANSSINSKELELIAQRIEVARQEVRVEKADFDIGYIQGEYFPFTNRDSEIGYSVGITIPIFQNNRAQIAERKLDEIELRNEFESEQFQDSVNRVLEYEYLKNLIAHHNQIVQQTEEIDLEHLVQNLARVEDYDPIAILEMKEGILKLEEVLLKSKQRVIEQYLEFLFTFDVLTYQPLINYLSEDLEPIE
ncbi:MAG: hypothetical protein JJ971_01130 [Balneolaceae bacterium]|nr:hypothetical protein [Balneolaceae bacterium]MBO6544973.1 hypothetical protein [Balneolaceae bacterium]MBO6646369.1 hypothetical protein [Balneolaceae bacterium]